MSKTYLGNDSIQAKQIACQLFTTANSFRIIHDGQENLIVVVDDIFIVRFPRLPEVWQRGITERRILERLSSKADMPVPQLLKVSEDPAYIVTTYLHGRQLLASDLRSLPNATLQIIGKNIATFAYMFHTSLALQEFQPLIQPPTWSYDDYLKRVLFERTDENPKIDALAKEYYQKWITRKPGGHNVVVHDDLHMGNLLFNDDFSITGVLDFGAVCVGTPEQELRQTYRLGEAGFEAAVSTYETLSGEPFDRDMAKLWTITQELATYCREDTDAAHARARENLEFWFPATFT